MSRPFSLYLTTEVPSVAVGPESFCAAESYPGTIFAKWQIEWLSLPASPFFPPDSCLRICGLGGLEGRGAFFAPWDSLLSLWLSGGKTEGRRGTCPSAFARGFYVKLVKAGEVKTRLGQCKAGEKSSLWEQSGLFCMAVGIPAASMPVVEIISSMRALQVFSWALWSPPDVLKYLLQWKL